ncbi:START-like protein [Gracilaria domingensis]|nr:START-like protein [Gracilaria domingensis]
MAASGTDGKHPIGAKAIAAAELPLRDSLYNRLEEIKSLYQVDKILQVSRVLSTVRDDIETLKSSPLPQSQQLLEEIQNTLSNPPYVRIASECSQLETLREGLSTEHRDGWTISYDGAQTKVWYRNEANTSSHSILIEGEIHAPLLNVAALIYEADLYERLFWYVTSAKRLEIENPTPLRRAAYITVFAPWPLYTRDVAVYAFAVDALDEDDCVIVLTKSIDDSHPVKEKVPAAGTLSRTVRADIHTSGFVLFPQSPGVTKARFLYNVNPHLAFVPMALVNWGARTICRWSMRTLETRAQNLDRLSPLYKERMQSHPFYDFVRSRLGQFWERKGMLTEGGQADQSGAVSVEHRRSHSFDPDVQPQLPPTSVIKAIVTGDRGQNSRKTSRVKAFFGGKRS